ncbi:MAG: HAMP domain-containing protein [Acidobacteriota bacterium]|nr:HAMP domain-containing protein [Acidobacteriota bacterium]
MRLGIKAKQVLGVTSIVGLVVVALSAIQLAALARMSLEESAARGGLLSSAIFQRARAVVAQGGDPRTALAADPGIRSLLESSIAYSPNVTYAAIVAADGTVIADSDPTLQGSRLAPEPALDGLLDRPAVDQLAAIYRGRGRTFEVVQPLLLDNVTFGAIRIGVSTLLIRQDLNTALRPALVTAAAALFVAMLVAMLLAQIVLRPIHVISSGLSRLGQGEFGVTLDLKPGDEFGELGSSFNAISARLSADRARHGDGPAAAGSPIEPLEDAVALVGRDGGLLFANPSMRAVLPADPLGRPLADLLPASHPYRRLVEDTLRDRRSRGPVSVNLEPEEGGAGGERLVLCEAVEDAARGFTGAMLLARNVGYLSQVESTLTYSRKLAALGRLSAGVAHEVKNPLNAMTIHLELLRQALSGGAAGRLARDEGEASAVVPSEQGALAYVDTIGEEIRRLDQVVQGFLKFTRPQEVQLEPLRLPALIEDLRSTIAPEADRTGVAIVLDCPADVPEVNGDPGLLRQVFLNLALNACQAMPDGGTLRISCGATRGRRVEVRVQDTGVGIAPGDLARIFDLYFTTKSAGSGIGLSMVYRIVQLHDGEIEVESTPGHGTTFRVLLPQAGGTLPPAGLGLTR